MKDLSNAMMMQFTKDYGNWTEDFVAVFDITKVDEAEVKRFINSRKSYHPYIMVVYQEQWESVFGKIN
jgi:hypothetical protein